MATALTGQERLALRAAAVRWRRDHRTRDAKALADGFTALMAERDRLAEQARKILARATEWEAAAQSADNEQANTRYWCAREVRGIFTEAARALDSEEARDA